METSNNPLLDLNPDANEWHIATGGGADSYAMIIYAFNELLRRVEEWVVLPKAIRIIHFRYGQVTHGRELVAGRAQASILNQMIQGLALDVNVSFHNKSLRSNTGNGHNSAQVKHNSVYVGGEEPSHEVPFRNLALTMKLVFDSSIPYGYGRLDVTESYRGIVGEGGRTKLVAPYPDNDRSYVVIPSVWVGSGYLDDHNPAASDANDVYFSKVADLLGTNILHVPLFKSNRSTTLNEAISGEWLEIARLHNVVQPCFKPSGNAVCKTCNSCKSLRSDHPELYDVLASKTTTY